MLLVEFVVSLFCSFVYFIWSYVVFLNFKDENKYAIMLSVIETSIGFL